jgi:hypothetical protein
MSGNLRKHDVECLRLAADCMQLAGDVGNPAWQRHFLLMAKHWTALAERGAHMDARTKTSAKRLHSAHANTSQQQLLALPRESNACCDAKPHDDLLVKA